VQSLLIYYGFPSLINGSQSLQEAVEHFRRYSMVVLGDGLHDPRHPNHEAALHVITQLPQVRFFGYVDLGVHSPHHRMQNLSLAEIEQRAGCWRRMGAVGILLDDYGYDFATTRERQIEAVDALHALKLSVIANSWDPRHALDRDPGPANPKGLPSPLWASDYYLYESYLVSRGQWISFKQWRAKANTLQKLLRTQPIQILSCTTTEQHDPLDLAWEFCSYCAWLEGHQALAWGEPHFSASDNQARWRPQPEYPEGRRGLARACGNGAMHCDCLAGQAVIDYHGKSFAVHPHQPWWRRWLPTKL
jgi:hypothetical protein